MARGWGLFIPSNVMDIGRDGELSIGWSLGEDRSRDSKGGDGDGGYLVRKGWLPRHEGRGVGAGFGVGKLLGSLVVLNDEAVDYLLWGVVDPFVS